MWQLEEAGATSSALWSLLTGIGYVSAWARLLLSELRQAAGHLPIGPSANPQQNHTSISKANTETSTKIMSSDNEALLPPEYLSFTKTVC